MQSATEPPTSWTIADAADDVVAQVGELVEAGAGLAGLHAALLREGVADATATALLEALGVAAKATDAGRWGIDLAPLLAALARGDDRDAAVEALVVAWSAHGIPPAVSRDVAAQIQQAQTRPYRGANPRLRRLGLQAMVAGCVFTAFFALVAVRAGETHAVWTALASTGLTIYGSVLWWRHRH